jgi:UDPglucose 6-dehydrogenase
MNKKSKKSARAQRPLIGFIGQGWIGKHYADDFEKRRYTVVRYAKEAPYEKNAAAIAGCDIVFIAVPTPTTPTGWDDSVVRSVLPLVGKGKIAVIKSTLLPGTTIEIQKKFPGIFVIHSPEFLSTPTAAYDAAHPTRNIVGIPLMTSAYKTRAKLVMSVLAPAPFELICHSTEAEIIKYGRNILGYMRVVATNIFYDLSQAFGVDWKPIRAAMSADEFNGPRYMTVVDQKGRGAGGVCFIKDFVAFKRLYEKMADLKLGGDSAGVAMLAAIEAKNVALLRATGKDIELIKGVYGI